MKTEGLWMFVLWFVVFSSEIKLKEQRCRDAVTSRRLTSMEMLPRGTIL